MREFEKPKILISRCIEHKACRYDGSKIKSDFVKKLKKHVDFITVCPEMQIGLPVPRESLRLVEHKDSIKFVFSKSGEDKTKDMLNFSNEFLNKTKEKENLHGIILKGRSPSCGIKDVKVYKTHGKAMALPKKERGLFGKAAIDIFENTPIEDEGRLTNYNIREHFLTRIYALADFSKIKKKKTFKSLVKFHSDNKYLLMSYSQTNLKTLGKLVANHEKKKIKEVLDEYEIYLNKALKTRANSARNMNMLLHLMGYFSKELNKDEKAFFLDTLQDYRNKKAPLSVPLNIIYSWVKRFDEPYLKTQTIFNPYPKELLDVMDSGKTV